MRKNCFEHNHFVSKSSKQEYPLPTFSQRVPTTFWRREGMEMDLQRREREEKGTSKDGMGPDRRGGAGVVVT